MKALKSYNYAFRLAWRSKKLSSIIYLLYLVFALLLTIPFYRLFVSISEYSLLPANLMANFDATAFGEIMRDSGKVFMVYIKGMWPWILVFLLLGTYLFGGIIAWISNPNGSFSIRTLFDKCSQFFWKFLRVSFYILLVQIIVAILIYLIPSILIAKEGVTDAYVVRTLSLGAFIHLLFMATISMIADITRFGIYQKNQKNVLKEIWRSLKFVFRNLGSLWMMFFMWIILPIGLIIIFYIIRKNFVVDTFALTVALFVIQQIFIWLRFLLRIQKQGMFFKYYIQDQIEV